MLIVGRRVSSLLLLNRDCVVVQVYQCCEFMRAIGPVGFGLGIVGLDLMIGV